MSVYEDIKTGLEQAIAYELNDKHYKELVKRLKSSAFTVMPPELSESAVNAIQILVERLAYYEDNAVILPHTIGNITYYSKEELFDWVKQQQLKMKF